MRMNDIRDEAARRFKGDIENHSIDVRHDDGLYRHIVCSNNGSWNHRFDIVTYPGYLVMSGDMGEWVFSRLTDMFEFFRSPKGKINPGYWAEKCRAGEIKEFSEKKFQKVVTDYVRSYFDDDFPEEIQERLYDDLMDDIKESLFEDSLSNDNAHMLVSEFEHYFDDDIGNAWADKNIPFRFEDTFELSFTDYKFHFLWALHAIVWTIGQYDKQKSKKEYSRNR